MKVRAIVWLVSILLGAAVFVAGARAQKSSASDATALLAISADGMTVTFRPPVLDELKVCFDPKAGSSLPVRCFTVGEIRRGDVRRVEPKR